MTQIEHFQQEINAIPYAVADRLWVKNPPRLRGGKITGFKIDAVYLWRGWLLSLEWVAKISGIRNDPSWS